ncbi:MAG: D-Ala-D-Ala carboxypeptidase family metallohydrolase [Acidobacteriota bacterium]|nr:D-Ala-D-Ala carboxypeptidase family metallohydrolase [Acidobacteriota bacterium]
MSQNPPSYPAPVRGAESRPNALAASFPSRQRYRLVGWSLLGIGFLLLAAWTFTARGASLPSKPDIPEMEDGVPMVAAAGSVCDLLELDRRFEERSGLSDIFQPDTLSFSLHFKHVHSPYRRMSAFLMPGETFELEAVSSIGQPEFRACSWGGTLQHHDSARWSWTAPEEPGIYRLYVASPTTGEAQQLHLFVMVPYEGERSLEGYRIGQYQSRPLRNNPAYNVPQGMVRVDRPEDLDIWVTPHFQLRQFQCKQAGDYPKFIIVKEKMLLKLERLLEEVNRRGIDARTFAVLSGFRTPQYNAAIGNPTTYSRHAYGDAADIFVDENGDQRMDDLDGDGRETVADARILAGIVEDLVGDDTFEDFIGGLGLYGPKPHRGPFVHVDTRGFRARW